MDDVSASPAVNLTAHLFSFCLFSVLGWVELCVVVHHVGVVCENQLLVSN